MRKFVALPSFYWCSVAASCCALLLGAAAHAAGPYDVFGVDPRSQAMGNAMTASASGYGALHYNPAAITLVDGVDAGFHFQLSLPQLNVQLDRPPDDELYQPQLPPPYAAMSGGAVFPIGGIFKNIAYLGTSIFMPASALAHFRAVDPATPFFYQYDTYTDHFEVEAALALKLMPWLSVAAGVRAAAAQTAEFRLRMDILRRQITEQQMNAVQVPVVRPTAGVLVGPFGTDTFRMKLGAAVREEYFMTVSAPATFVIDGLDVQLDAPLLAVSNYSPRSFNAGLQMALGGLAGSEVEISADLLFAQWSLAPTPFLQASSQVSGQTVEDLGFSGALDTPAEGDPGRAVPPGFQDTLSFRFGTEVFFLKRQVAVRAGYAYRPTPVPDQTSGSNIVDNTAHVVSVGAGVQMPDIFEKPLFFDFAWQSQILQTRRTEKEDVDDPVGPWTSNGAVHAMTMGFRYVW